MPESIAEFIPIPLIVESLSACLNATTTFGNGATVPDCRTRLETAKLLLGYMIGTSTPRKEVAPDNKGFQDERSREDLLTSSPAIVTTVKKALARVEARKASIDV